MKKIPVLFKFSNTIAARVYYFVAAIFLLTAGNVSFAQAPDVKNKLLNIVTLSDSLGHKEGREKLYLQFDKPWYAVGDTIWFKAYLLNSYLTASGKSGMMYIDIANDSNKVIKQYRLPVATGLSWGNISLDEKFFTAGTYTIRAYTNWMRNFGTDYFFNKTFYIAGMDENGWLVNKQVKQSVENGGNTAEVKLQLSDINKIPAANKTLQLHVMAGNKHLYKQTIQTDPHGLLNINFKIPEKSANLGIEAESIPTGKKAVIPINLSRPEDIDLQFLPEGGNMVAGLPAHVGFKAIGADGKGVDVSGIITDNNQQQVTEFKSLHNGMGSFDLAAQNGESYTAKVTLPGGTTKEYPLPAVKNTGTILKVQNQAESDSLEVSIAAAGDIGQSGNSYFLIGKARGIVCYAAVFNFHDGGLVKRKIAKSLFPTGITHFTLMTAGKQPVNERLVYIDHHDNLGLQVKTNHSVYGPRDSVALKIKVVDNTGRPVEGSFSLAVTDDAQVKTDALEDENILTRMLLTSDLKGYIEQPGYYLSSKSTEAWQALDNLLLTQGWVGYNWEQVFNPPAITYQSEHDFTVKGSVVNVFNKPVKGTDVLLFSKTPAILMDTLTDKGGKFTFDRFPRIDTPVFIIKAVNKHGKSFNVGISIDETKPPEFTTPNAPLKAPWYVNSDTTLLNYTKSDALKQQTEYYKTSGHLLKEVTITSKKIIKGSQNLNGPGNADIVLDEKDLEAVGKKTWLRLLEEGVPGFREMDVIKHYPRWYYMHYKKVFFIIDGISLTDMYQSLDFLSLKDYLQSQDAEDIKGVEVMSKDIHAENYASRFFPLSSSDTLAFIEITTRSGHGPIIHNTPGVYLYRPLAISIPKQFYKPKYAVNDTTKHLPDLRSTVDWEPNIKTGINGEARIFFYTADKPSTYTITIEGADMNGNLGVKTGKVVVK